MSFERFDDELSSNDRLSDLNTDPDPLLQNPLLKDPLLSEGSTIPNDRPSLPLPLRKKQRPGLDLLTIGEAMVELSCDGDIRFARTLNKSFGGDTLNTAVAAQRLGSKCGFVTRLGNDPFAYSLKETLIKEGIAINQTRMSNGQTGMYIASVDNQGEKQGQRSFYYYRKNSAAAMLQPEDLNIDQLLKAKIVFASGISLAISDSARRTVQEAFAIARQHNIMTALDINYRESLWGGISNALDALNDILPYVDIILPSTPEDTKNLIGFSRPDQVVDYFLYKGVKLVAVKAGKDGCYLGYKRERQHFPAMHIQQVIDTTGAGDAFNGGFLHGLASEYSLMHCAKLGIITSGLKVQTRGTIEAMPYREAVYSRIF